jgi:hypothetical protein
LGGVDRGRRFICSSSALFFITGSFQDKAGVVHGFVRNPYGTITTFDPPEGTEANVTCINDGGAIGGSYQYGSG